MNMTNKQTAIVTGASRGIGLATAKKLLQLGMNVALCSRSEKNIQEAATPLIEQYPGRALALAADVSDAQAVKLLFETTFKTFGRVDICINNAGTLQKKSFTDATDQEWWKEFNNNFTSAYHCCKAAFYYMSQTSEPSFIVNISSLSGIRFVEKFPDMSAYISSKHALVGLTESLAVEGAPYNIHVNCVAPGGVDTQMFQDNFHSFTPGATPEEIANIIALFCQKDQLGSVNGNIFEVFCNA